MAKKKKKKNIIPIFALSISSLSLVIVLPNILFSSSLSSYGTIYESESFFFPENLSPKVDLNILTDVGDIKIEYVEPLLDTYGKIDVNFKMRGSDLAGKLYTDYFSLDWQTTNSSANFTLELLSESWFDSSLWSLKNVSIVVTLRKDIVFDISVAAVEGNVDVKVPYLVSLNKIVINTSRGDISYDFNYCLFEGNKISGYTNEGDFKLKANNIQCNRNMNWNLTILNGDVVLQIDQTIEMGANITGTVVISSGKLQLNYFDNNSDVGAIFIFPLFNLPYPPPPHPGFETDVFEVAGLNEFGHLYKTIGFPAKSNFNLKFNLINGIYDLNIMNQ